MISRVKPFSDGRVTLAAPSYSRTFSPYKHLLGYFLALFSYFEQLFAFRLSNSSSYLLILGYRSSFQCLNRPFFHISRCLVDNLWISCQTKNKKWAKSYPLRSWAQDKSSRPTRSAVFMKIQNVDEDSHSTDLSASALGCTWRRLLNNFIGSVGFYWGQSYLTTLVTPQNCTKMLRNLTFFVQFAYFSIRPKKCFVFSSTF